MIVGSHSPSLPNGRDHVAIIHVATSSRLVPPICRSWPLSPSPKWSSFFPTFSHAPSRGKEGEPESPKIALHDNTIFHDTGITPHTNKEQPFGGHAHTPLSIAVESARSQPPDQRRNPFVPARSARRLPSLDLPDCQGRRNKQPRLCRAFISVTSYFTHLSFRGRLYLTACQPNPLSISVVSSFRAIAPCRRRPA